MDIQITDYENAALIVILGMINNIVNHFDLDFIMPISKIDENMKRAEKPDSVLKEKFWFKLNILPTGKCYKFNTLEESDYIQSNKLEVGEDRESGCRLQEEECHYVLEELYIHEILAGKPEIKFKGVYPLIREYMESKQYDKEIV